MPTVSVGKDRLCNALGRNYTDEEFDRLCFEYGIELDDVTTEKEIIRKELHVDAADVKDASEEVLYKIEVPANRYDMLCLEGISRALNVFSRRSESPSYKLADMSGKKMQQMVVKPETALIRPFVVCAILRGVQLDATRYASFIDLQDKLHTNICRQRSLVAIGTHDLSTIQGPFTYEALPPSDIKFVPLKQTREFKADELMQYYLENDQKLRKFVPLIADSLVYPVIYDAHRTVLSLPPIINSAHSAIKLETRDIFIECTATDLTKAKIVLNTVCCMFSEYCTTPFEVEPVEVIDAFGTSQILPDLSYRRMDVSAAQINGALGLELSASDVATLLTRMQLSASVSESDPGAISLLVPPSRSDILHACDIVEDVAIAHGFNNIPRRLPVRMTPGSEQPLNQFSELVRMEVALAGFTELLTWALVSRAENFAWLRRPDDGQTAVEIGNPATIEFEICRSTLLPGMLKTLGANKKMALPLQLFEVGDIILLDSSKDVGARNERRLAAVFCNTESGFEVIHGLLNRVMEVLGVPWEGDSSPSSKKQSAAYEGDYGWRPSEDPAFFPGRQATIISKGKEVGVFGTIHPEVLAHFDIPYPVSAMEINLEPFCFDQLYRPLC